MSSEEGEIPAKEEPSRNGGDDEVLAAAVIDENDEESSQGSEVVVAKVIDDEPGTAAAVVSEEATPKVTATDEAKVASASVKPVKKEEEEEEEDGEVVEDPVDKNKAAVVDGGKGDTSTPASAEPNKKKDSIDSEVSANKPASKAVKTTEKEASLVKKEVETNQQPKSTSNDVEKPKESTAPKEPTTAKQNAGTDEPPPKEVKPKDVKPSNEVVKPKEVAPPKKKKDEDDEEEEGEIEEGELDDPTPKPPPPKPSSDDATKKPLGSKKPRPKDNAANKDARTPAKKEPKEDSVKAKVDSVKKEPKVDSVKAKMDAVKDVEMRPVHEGKANNQKKEASVGNQKKEATVSKKKKKKSGKPADNSDSAAATPKDKPTPMEVDELKSKVSESSSEAKKGDDDDEDGEIKEEGELKEDTESDTKEDTEEEGEIKEDADMEDALSQSEEGGDRDADMQSVDGDDASFADEPAAKKPEPSYSTRGRSSGTTTPVPRESTAKSSSLTAATAASAGSNEQWQRSVREALEDLGRGSSKEGTPAGVGPGGASFLEALGEEERRTRTRFLPAVDGIHMLRKNEVKGDLALARSIMSNAGTVANVASVAAGAPASLSVSKKSKKKKHDSSSEADSMDTDDVGTMSSSEEDPSMEGRVGSTSTIDVDDGDVLTVPSSAFVPPPAATHSSNVPASNGEKHEEGAPPPVPTGVKGILNNQRNIKSPRVVECVTAFNPPRPPESVGKKKQHRMLRWERRPADVELDLNSYRKTVDRTRKELHTEEAELERIEATSNHLRRHFLAHLRCMDDEMDQIMAELNSLQQNCVTAADLLTSRTRSRGAGKGSYVMKDVLTVLKARGAELDEKGLSPRSDVLSSNDNSQHYPGLGGVGASSFSDWNEKSTFPHYQISSAWVLPDDKVKTPYGEGVVTSISDSTISVKMPFGVGHFNPATVTSKESPNVLTDARLAKRWKAIVDSAVTHTGRLDLNGMASVESMMKPKHTEQHDKSKEGTTNGGAGGAGDAMDTSDPEPQAKVVSPDETKLLPFGSTLLPTGTGRGDGLFDLSAIELEKEFKSLLTEGTGILGATANDGVPTDVKDFEGNTQEAYVLQAKVLQLRNELYRQRRIRTFNEKTFTATRDRSIRAEGLVSEMRTDLKSLKYRLDEELKELGIDQDRAEAILKSYYTSHDYGEHDFEDAENHNESPSSKRTIDDDENSKGDTLSPVAEQKTTGNGSSDSGGERQAKRPRVASV